MASSVSGRVTAFFLFDVAEAADLAAVRTRVGAAGQDARFAPRSAIPAYVRYQQPPVQIDGEALGLSAPDGWSPRLKVYDYGVVSLALSRPFDGTWTDLLALSQAVMNGAPLDATAEAYCRAAATSLRPASTGCPTRATAGRTPPPRSPRRGRRFSPCPIRQSSRTDHRRSSPRVTPCVRRLTGR